MVGTIPGPTVTDGVSPHNNPYIGSYAYSVRQALRLSPDNVLDVFMEPDLDILRRRGALEAVARELGKPTAAAGAKR